MLRLLADVDMSLIDLLSKVSSLGGTAVMAGVIYAFLRGAIVTAAQHEREKELTKQMLAERDEWKNAALRSLRNNERAVGAVERVTNSIGDSLQKSRSENGD